MLKFTDKVGSTCMTNNTITLTPGGCTCCAGGCTSCSCSSSTW